MDIRDQADSSDLSILPGGEALIKPFYGIQEIPAGVGGYNGRSEWGSIRARLNEAVGETREMFRGQYLHGKLRPGDYTHGCICERSEAILNRLLRMDPRTTPKIPVWVKRP